MRYTKRKTILIALRYSSVKFVFWYTHTDAKLCYDERKGKKGKCAPFSDDRCRKKDQAIYKKSLEAMTTPGKKPPWYCSKYFTVVG